MTKPRPIVSARRAKTSDEVLKDDARRWGSDGWGRKLDRDGNWIPKVLGETPKPKRRSAR